MVSKGCWDPLGPSLHCGLSHSLVNREHPFHNPEWPWASLVYHRWATWYDATLIWCWWATDSSSYSVLSRIHHSPIKSLLCPSQPLHSPLHSCHSFCFFDLSVAFPIPSSSFHAPSTCPSQLFLPMLLWSPSFRLLSIHLLSYWPIFFCFLTLSLFAPPPSGYSPLSSFSLSPQLVVISFQGLKPAPNPWLQQGFGQPRHALKSGMSSPIHRIPCVMVHWHQSGTSCILKGVPGSRGLFPVKIYSFQNLGLLRPAPAISLAQACMDLGCGLRPRRGLSFSVCHCCQNCPLSSPNLSSTHLLPPFLPVHTYYTTVLIPLSLIHRAGYSLIIVVARSYSPVFGDSQKTLYASGTLIPLV